MVSVNDTLSRKQEKTEYHIPIEGDVHNVHATSPRKYMLGAPVAPSYCDLLRGIILPVRTNPMKESESPEHIAAKERIRDIAIKFGMVAANEVLFPCWSFYHNHPVMYRADVYIFDPLTKRNIIVEIHGYKGHDSSYSWFKDRIRRVDDIRMWYGDNMEFPPPIDLDSVRISTPLDILQSIGFDA